MTIEQVPEAMKNLNRWHVWTNRNGVKIPKQVNGDPAKSNDSGTWTDFRTAADASSFFTGLAFELGDGITGVDLDDCLDDEGCIKPWAWPIVGRLDGVAYGEVSPSGTGMKFTTFAQKPSGARCVHKIGEGKEALECYDKARFWTVTGNVYNAQTEIGDGQAAIDWICNEYLKPSVGFAAPAPIVREKSILSESPLMARAERYVQNLPAGMTENSGRNAAAFSNAGHLWSFVDDFGNGLSGDQVVGLMRDWNARNVAPLDDKELLHVTDSASRNGTARSAKSPTLLIPDDNAPRPDISGLRVKAGQPLKEELKAQLSQEPLIHEPLKRRKVVTESDFPSDAMNMPGLLGDIVRHNLKTAIYPLPELAFAGALSMMSVLTGGKVARGKSRTNLFTMGLAPSGSGKDHARVINAEILTAIGRKDICGPERIGSHAGIVSTMSEHWQSLLQIDEVNRLFATMQNAQQSPHLYNITTVLLQIYGSTGRCWTADAYGDSKKQKEMNFPHCVLYGTGVPDGFWESVTKAQLTEGLIGRFLIFEEPNYVPWNEAEDEELPVSIIERARAWVEYQPQPADGSVLALQHKAANPRQIEFTAGAKELLDSHAKKISVKRMNEATVEAAIWSRQAEKTNKIAILLACSRWEGDAEDFPEVTEQDADQAITLHNWLTRRMLKRAGLHISENQTERDVLRVLRMLQSRDEWSQTELCRKTRWLKPRERSDILQSLKDNGDIIAEEVATGGRIRQVFRAISEN